jgi:DNA repair exonuclease SbcCD nuclease subunit
MTIKPYGIISDTHNHAWNAFSTVSPEGVNSRLQIILDEFDRCAAAVKAAGGDTIYHAGDLFHVRGSVQPSVLNPTRHAIEAIGEKYDMAFYFMPGNHDMELKGASQVGDSVQAVAGPHAVVLHGTTLLGSVLMVPWIANIEELKAVLVAKANENPHMATVDLIIHAPVDGVIKGIPDHGLDPQWLKDLGFNNVFAGHYHNHVDFGDGVYSIGALTHHTWSDVGSKAGFLIVKDRDVQWHSTHAPQFVDIEPGMDDMTLKELADGNYCRARLDSKVGSKTVEEVREHLISLGAKGVNIISVKAATHVRAASTTVKAGSSLEVAVAEYIKDRKFNDMPQVIMQCQKILSEATVL